MLRDESCEYVSVEGKVVWQRPFCKFGGLGGWVRVLQCTVELMV